MENYKHFNYGDLSIIMIKIRRIIVVTCIWRVFHTNWIHSCNRAREEEVESKWERSPKRSVAFDFWGYLVNNLLMIPLFLFATQIFIELSMLIKLQTRDPNLQLSTPLHTLHLPWQIIIHSILEQNVAFNFRHVN